MTDAAQNPDSGYTAFARFAGPRLCATPAPVSEQAAVVALLPQARVDDATRAQVAATATRLIEALRAKPQVGPVQAMVREFALTSPEGVALMCLAEALLRIPDPATRDALIRDKLAHGAWGAHLGRDRPLSVNAAAWGLLITGRLAEAHDEAGLVAGITRMAARIGEPVIRAAVDAAMRALGEQFVLGETIGAALSRGATLAKKGWRHSFDMLGEAALTASDAARYHGDYAAAIAAIGAAAGSRGPVEGPGISVKLSALHPRYGRASAERVLAELAPHLHELARAAAAQGIGLTIDAEESPRLDLSLALFEQLARDPALRGWGGLGLVVQAYQLRAPAVIDRVIALAEATGERPMVRLVKGAYWDSEIKRAQVEGLNGFPVYTRKVHTDVAWLACARQLLAARPRIFPQFATHNAHSLATIHHLAGQNRAGEPNDWEFQCLHGMGEALYGQVIGPSGLDRACRIYAPVGTHETLLAYLVRRLLENGANSSFVHRLADPAVPMAELIADPAEQVATAPDPGAPHEAIAAPAELFPGRRNSAGLDLADEATLAALGADLAAAAVPAPPCQGLAIANPADPRDVVGYVTPTDPATVGPTVADAAAAAAMWAARPVDGRADILQAAADALEADRAAFVALLVREAGKSVANAVGELREAVDFLRYYAAEARERLAATAPLGVIGAISPWNFPLAIFTGQIAAALAAGNAVVAKPAPQTPLVARQMIALLHRAGVPREVLVLVCGGGDVGAAMVAAPALAGVLFTGSTATAQAIARALAGRTLPCGHPVPLIAETGGINAMLVDSSALAEQVVGDVLVSAFDSAGQRCSALRLLCLQDDIAAPMVAMLRGAMAELRIGSPDRLATDIGPVIDATARERIESHVAALRREGCAMHRPAAALPASGHFVAPTLIELTDIAQLRHEVFGPVLHVLRYPARGRDALLTALRAKGYGLTFGLHTRIDASRDAVIAAANVGNAYVNRAMIGAVVGSQPFGGHGLSGTGPKAGGPLYLDRLVRCPPPPRCGTDCHRAEPDPAAQAFAAWLCGRGYATLAQRVYAIALAAPLGLERRLPGPVGEDNVWRLGPRGRIGVVHHSRAGLCEQIAAVLATGNQAVVLTGTALNAGIEGPIVTTPPPDWPTDLGDRVIWLDADPATAPDLTAVLVEGEADAVHLVGRLLAQRDGPLVPLHAQTAADAEAGRGYPLALLLREHAVSINTAAAGGNASLLALA